MLTPEQYDGISSVSVPSKKIRSGIEELKKTLDNEKKQCSECGYKEKKSRWGIKNYKESSDKTVLILCCPSCETPVDLTIEGKNK